MSLLWDFQNRARAWGLECLGYALVYDERERAHRMLEEAVEVFQSMGRSAEEAHAIVAWKMEGEPGEIQQEIGGLMMTVSVLCSSRAIDLITCAENGLADAYERIEEVRAKQLRKPRFEQLWRGREA